MVEVNLEKEQTAIFSTCGRESLIQELRLYANLAGKYLFPIRIGMPCGHNYLFRSESEFPTKTLKCDCGNENHYVVWYFLH